jgi:hypothetical protein
VPTVLRAVDLADQRDDSPVRNSLGAGLRRQLANLDRAMEAPWTTHNLARAQAHAALDARRAELESFPFSARRARGWGAAPR